jgi:hypothetical protein
MDSDASTATPDSPGAAVTVSLTLPCFFVAGLGGTYPLDA